MLAPGGEAYDAVVREFGRGILAGRRRDRPPRAGRAGLRLARTPGALNSLVHPPVFRREEHWLAEFAARDPHGIAVVEAAILIETGSYKRFDRMILVTCSEEQQMERAMRRDGRAGTDVRARLSRQMPLDEKRKFADFVIDTSGEKENTLRQTRAVYEVFTEN